MDLIDKETIEKCIKEGEILKRNLRKYIESRGFVDSLNDDVLDWWKMVKSELQGIGLHDFDNSFYLSLKDPVGTIQMNIEGLKRIIKNSERGEEGKYVVPANVFVGPWPAKDTLRLIYATSYIYDADDPENEMRLKNGFRSDLLALCFKNPARPLRRIPIRMLEDKNKEYTLKELKKKDGPLKNLRKEWSKKFHVGKHIIEELIKLENTPDGYFLIVSENIGVEFKTQKEKSSEK